MSLDEEYFDLSDIKPEKRIGQGTFGDVYSGEFKEDKMEGVGKYIFSDGDYHIGEYKDDVKNGKGIMYYLQDK